MSVGFRVEKPLVHGIVHGGGACLPITDYKFLGNGRSPKDAPSLEVFKSGLNGALGSLIQWVAKPAHGRGLRLDRL